MKIGFVGLGNMGAPMAINLVNAGNEVVGFDLVGVIPTGVTKAQTAQDAAIGTDVVITMLPNGVIAHSVAKDILPIMKEGGVLLRSWDRLS
jgi:3-hydroxyisobutyrate dehydrogenase